MLKIPLRSCSLTVHFFSHRHFGRRVLSVRDSLPIFLLCNNVASLFLSRSKNISSEHEMNFELSTRGPSNCCPSQREIIQVFSGMHGHASKQNATPSAKTFTRLARKYRTAPTPCSTSSLPLFPFLPPPRARPSVVVGLVPFQPQWHPAEEPQHRLPRPAHRETNTGYGSSPPPSPLLHPPTGPAPPLRARAVGRGAWSSRA